METVRGIRTLESILAAAAHDAVKQTGRAIPVRRQLSPDNCLRVADSGACWQLHEMAIPWCEGE
jgi:hypothetical protein